MLDCWLYGGGLNQDGYGKFGDRSQCPEIYAHRVVWHEVFGPVQRALEVDHACGVRNCVNPLHLRQVTVARNRATRVFKLKAECPQGHPYSGRNLYINPGTGGRVCRACVSASTKRWYDRNVRPVQRYPEVDEGSTRLTGT